jgi:hypothetical protein
MIETPNTSALVSVVGRQNQNTTAATPAMPLTIMMTARFMALMLEELSRTWEPDGIKETGGRIAAPHSLQKMSPVPAGAPQREQVALRPPLGSIEGHHTLHEDSWRNRIIKRA